MPWKPAQVTAVTNFDVRRFCFFKRFELSEAVKRLERMERPRSQVSEAVENTNEKLCPN